MADLSRPVRVMHIVPGSFGHGFSGITHRLYSLLSGWQDQDIVLDLWGTDVKPVNMNSGDAKYRLRTSLWTGSRHQGLLRRAWESVRLLGFVTLKAGSFDIVHFHTQGWGALASPVILHLLGRRALYDMSLFGSDNPSAVRLQRGGRLALALQRRFDGIVAVSPRLAEDCRQHNFRNVLFLPNFLAMTELEAGQDPAARKSIRSQLSIRDSDIVLLCVGGVIKRKGIDMLVECFARCARQNQRLWLIVAGPLSGVESSGETRDFVSGVKARIHECGLDSRVTWTGTITDKRVLASYYSAADIFVLPTRAEGLPNVLIEASAAGLPIVATNLPGMTDYVVKDGLTGLLFPLNDIDGLTSAVRRLIDDPVLRRTMGQAAREHSRLFDFETYRSRLREFYLAIAARPTTSSDTGCGQ